MYKNGVIKIIVIGPQASGKSTIVNFLANKANVLQQPYRPTAGLRIVQSQFKNPKRPTGQKLLVQLWDLSGQFSLSGNMKYERCWPAVQKNAHGVIIVFNQENPKHELQVDSWIQKFPKACNIPTSMCVAFAHHLSGKTANKKANKIRGAGNLTVVDSSIEQGNTTIKPAFDNFFSNLMQGMQDRQQKQENNLMNYE